MNPLRGELTAGIAAMLLLAPASARAQTAKDTQRTLEAELKNKQLPIRDFLADPVIHYRWRTDHLEHASSWMFTVGLLEVNSVKVHDTGGGVDR